MSVRRWLWRHPEAIVLALSAMAWALLYAPGTEHLPFSMMRSPEMSSAMSMPGTSASTQMPAMPGTSTTGGWTVPTFALMVVAMMLPASTAPVRFVAARSLWRRRNRATILWTLGYLGIWILVGAAILSARTIAIVAGVLHPGKLALVVGLVTAAAWQLTPAKRLALNGCHRTRPLAPSGPRADRDCLVCGSAIGRDCVISCGPMMAAMTFGTGNETLLMIAITTLALTERVQHRPSPHIGAIALGLLCITAL
jgi:hypothetical protein